jgi:hypothetical protein
LRDIDDKNQELAEPARITGDGRGDWLRARLSQLQRLPRQLPILPASAVAVHALRRLRLPFLRGVAVFEQGIAVREPRKPYGTNRSVT